MVWLRMRNLLLRLLAACQRLSQPPAQQQSSPSAATTTSGAAGDHPGGSSTDAGPPPRVQANGEQPAGTRSAEGSPLATAASLLDALKEVAREADDLPTYPQPYPVLCPQPGRLGPFVSGGCLRVLLAAFQWVVDLCRLAEEFGADAPPDAKIKVGDSLAPLVKSMVSKVSDLKIDSLHSTHFFLEAFTNATEAMGWCSLVAALGSPFARPARQAVPKKGKKKAKEAGTTDEAPQKHFVALLGQLESGVCDLQATLGRAQSDLLASLMASVNLDPEEPFLPGTTEKERQQVRLRIEQSYANSFKELGSMLDSKLKLLQSLRA